MKLTGFGEEEVVRDSNLSEDDLSKVYDSVKYIAMIENKDKALNAIDSLVSQLMEQYDYVDHDNEWEEEEIEKAQAEIKEFKNQIEKFKKSITNNDFEYYDINHFKGLIDELDLFWSRDVKLKVQNAVNEAKETACQVAADVEQQFHKIYPEKSIKQELFSITSVKSVLDSLKISITYLDEHNLLDDKITEDIRKSKERLAWYRAKKKLADAEVAEGGGNTKKAEKLKGEAKVMLKQDWEKIFPDEDEPDSMF